MDKRRFAVVVAIRRKMGLTRKGHVRMYDVYLDPTPLLGKAEREDSAKARIVSEFVWVIHRSICHRLPFVTNGICSVTAGVRLLTVCGKLMDHIIAKRLNPKMDRKHNGFSLANTVVDGGTKGCSGTVHWSNFFDEDLALGNEFFEVLQDVIVSAFQDCEWFQFINHFLRTHENPFLSDRLMNRAPVTNVWLTIKTAEYNIHEDDRNAFIGFLCVPDNYKGGELVISDPDFNVGQPIHIKKCDVIAG
jgi:hypothetical protein